MTIASILVNCAEDPTTAFDHRPSRDLLTEVEGEVLGRIYENGNPTTRSGLAVVLTPKGNTAERLKGDYSLRFNVDPTADLHFEWFDPASSDGPQRCGPLTEYNAGNMMARSVEVHALSGSGKEMHCIRPGVYILTLEQNGEPIPGASFDVEYQQIETVDGSAVTVYEGSVEHKLASRLFDEAGGSGSIVDLFVNIDLGQPSGTDSVILSIDNALSDPRKSTFAPAANPGGTPDDYFRFSLRESTVSWLPNQSAQRGRLLARFFWDAIDPLGPRTGYRDVHSGSWILQPFKYGQLAANKSSVSVGVDVKAPDQLPSDAPQSQRTITMSGSGPGACITVVPTRVWLGTDFQVKGSAECYVYAIVEPIRLSWVIAAIVTPYSQSAEYTFPGFTTSGTHNLELRVKNVQTGQISTDTVPINVLPYQVTIQGPALVKDKLVKHYVGNISAQWFERFLPQETFYPATSETSNDSLPRIWPATSTEYYAEVLEQSFDSATLKRGKLMVRVCGSTYAGCMAQLNVSSSSDLASEQWTTEGNVWSIFGGGPVLSWGSSSDPRVVRLYDLRGNHARGSAFSSPGGLLESSGEDRQRLSIGVLKWDQVAVPNAKLVRFVVDPPGSGTVFGMALDPDLGEHAWDDTAGYDSQRGLLYVADLSGVVGFVLRTAGENAIASVQQYGARHFAPGTDQGLWKAQRNTAINLLEGDDDIQLILSASSISQVTEYELALIRAGSLEELRSAFDNLARQQAWSIR